MEIKSDVATITAPIQEDAVALPRQERIARAKAEIFTEYDTLLRELAK